MAHRFGQRPAEDKNPIRPQKQGFCVPNSLFFHLQPNLFSPAGNLQFIPLGSALYRLLWRPFQLLEQSGNMGSVVCHSKFLFNYFSDTGTSPHCTTKSIRFCTMSKKIG